VDYSKSYKNYFTQHRNFKPSLSLGRNTYHSHQSLTSLPHLVHHITLRFNRLQNSSSTYIDMLTRLAARFQHALNSQRNRRNRRDWAELHPTLATPSAEYQRLQVPSKPRHLLYQIITTRSRSHQLFRPKSASKKGKGDRCKWFAEERTRRKKRWRVVNTLVPKPGWLAGWLAGDNTHSRIGLPKPRTPDFDFNQPL